MSDKSEIILLGGVHGAGKSTLCRSIATQNHLITFTASELIRSASANAIDKHSKHVKDASKNQTLLIEAFSLARQSSPSCDVLLDGHFVLQSKQQTHTKIGPEVFAALQITRLICLIAEPSVLAKRLKKRDAIQMDQSAIANLQQAELAHAKFIAKLLALPLLVLESPIRQQKARFSDGYTLLLSPPGQNPDPFAPPL